MASGGQGAAAAGATGGNGVASAAGGTESAALKAARSYNPYNGQFKYLKECVGTLPNNVGQAVFVFVDKNDSTRQVEVKKADIETSKRRLSELIRDRTKQQSQTKVRQLGQTASQTLAPMPAQLRQMADDIEQGAIDPLAEQEKELASMDQDDGRARGAPEKKMKSLKRPPRSEPDAAAGQPENKMKSPKWPSRIEPDAPAPAIRQTGLASLKSNRLVAQTPSKQAKPCGPSGASTASSSKRAVEQSAAPAGAAPSAASKQKDDEPQKKKMRRARKSYPTAKPQPPDAPSAGVSAAPAAAAQGKDGQAKPKAPASGPVWMRPQKALVLLRLSNYSAKREDIEFAFRKQSLKGKKMASLRKARDTLISMLDYY